VKKAKSGKRGTAATRHIPPKTIEEYVARIPESSRSIFTQLRAAIRSAVPAEATETISYRIPAFKTKGVLVWFAAFSGHCSLFPTASVIEEFKKELKDYRTSKGTIHFANGKPMPTALVKKIVKARVAQAEGEKQRREV